MTKKTEMNELKFVPIKNDVLCHYHSFVDIGRTLASLFPKHPKLKEMYEQLGVGEVLKEVVNNPECYKLNLEGIANEINCYLFSPESLEYKYLPEHLYETILQLVRGSKLTASTITVTSVADLLFSSLWRDVWKMDVESLLFLHGFIGFSGSYEPYEVYDLLQAMSWETVNCIDLEKLKKEVKRKRPKKDC